MKKNIAVVFLFLCFCNVLTQDCYNIEEKKKQICESLKSTIQDEKCYYKGNDQCISFYDDCDKYVVTGDLTIDENKCKSISPSDKLYKCHIDSGQCKKVKKSCDEYQTGIDCTQLKSLGENQSCLLFYGQCINHYDKCEDIGDSTTCENNKLSDKSQKCVWDDSSTPHKCTMDGKKCKDYDIIDEESTCNYPTSNNKKVCIKSGSSCIEVYAKCENYENSDRTIRCQDIIPLKDDRSAEENLKCVVDNGQCKTENKKCEDFDNTSESDCSEFHLSDSSKKCVYTDRNKCIEVHRTCEAETDQAKCSLTQPDDLSFKCVYENNACTKKRKRCSDFLSHQPKEYCTSIIPEDTKYRCYYYYSGYNNNCGEMLKECENYEGNYKSICESIILEDSNKLCHLENDRKCVTKQKTCSDYSSFQCYQFIPSDKSKRCISSGNKCVEETIYKYCSDYRGSNSNYCQSIQPYDDSGANIEAFSKCVYTSSLGCEKQENQCSDANYNDYKCKNMILKDNKKKCVYDGTYCIETYKTCEDYVSTSSISISSNTCENIVLDDLTKKCTFKRG